MQTRAGMRSLIVSGATVLALAVAGVAWGGDVLPLAPGDVEAVGVDVATAEFQGREALKVTEEAGAASGERMAVIRDLIFDDGTIEVDVAGQVAPQAIEGARGFVGIAFRVQEDRSRYECFYLRPTNGRAEDQLRRNHSVQYVSHPDFSWYRLRQETPGQYESYVDLVPGEWTSVKIVVSDRDARLFVHGADQPTLIVTDLKLDASSGGIGLWIGPGTVAHFANLRVTRP